MIDARAREAVVNSAWFQDLPDTAIDALATAAQIKPFPVSSFIYSQGEKTTELYCTLSKNTGLRWKADISLTLKSVKMILLDWRWAHASGSTVYFLSGVRGIC